MHIQGSMPALYLIVLISLCNGVNKHGLATRNSYFPTNESETVVPLLTDDYDCACVMRHIALENMCKHEPQNSCLAV